jgi:hypothetical protein
MQPKEPLGRSTENSRPLLMVDVDGVISLFGLQLDASGRAPGVDGSFHSIDGIPHFLSSTAAGHLLALAELFDLVWCSGWEEKADEYLPRLLGLPDALPHLRFSRDPEPVSGGGADGGRVTTGHWKLDAIDAYACGRPLAWIDDALGPACHEWAAGRPAPTLLVQTAPERGLTRREAQLLADWARLGRAPQGLQADPQAGQQADPQAGQQAH